jgi:hypothetical protein
MSAPKRIQRRRSKGWQMPEGAVYVGRPSKWGNPWRIGQRDAVFMNGAGVPERFTGLRLSPTQAVDLYRRAAGEGVLRWQPSELAELAGRDLACWCPPDQPCHADVLLAIANGGQTA